MATHLHKHVHAATRKVFERYGFAYAEVLSRWREIVGEEVAAYSAPERIRWPRLASGSQAAARRKLGGTLVIRVADGRAVELQHDSARIIDKVNTYYGYEAITGVSIVHGPLPEGEEGPTHRPTPSPEQERRVECAVASVEDDSLRRALTRLGRGALARNQSQKGS